MLNVSNSKTNPNIQSATIKSLIIKKITCVIGSEWIKGLLFFLVLSLKLILELIFVLNIKENSQIENISLTIIAILLYTINTFLCFQCVIGNPGILPANSSLQQKISVTKKIKWFVLKGRVFKLKHCTTCCIVRPIGSGHCKKCNVCIERYDHHCPWVGSCIGRNNYKYFFFLLISINVYFISSLSEDIACFVTTYACLHEKNTILNHRNCQMIFLYDVVAIGDNESRVEYRNIVKASMYLSLIWAIMNLLGLLFVFILLIRHLSFLSRNETTYLRVKLKNILQVYGNHFDKGIYNNIKDNLFKVFSVRKIRKTNDTKFILKVNTFPMLKINESNFPINVSYNCYVSYNSRNGYNYKNHPGSMIQTRNDNIMIKSPKINGTFSNISKSFEEDLYSQQNTLIQYKNDNASSSFRKSKNGSVNDLNILKPNVFFANHEEDGNELRLPNVISTNIEFIQ